LTTRASSLRDGRPIATNLALLLFGIITIEFCRTGVTEFRHFVHGYSESVFAQIAVYLGAISLVERCPTNKWTLRIILAVALLARLFCVFAPPFLSTDIYRYVWDGNVQMAGINPFRYIPADNHLAFLRDGSIYAHINRRDSAPTIYPPGAQLLFLGITRISATVTFMKLALVGFEAVTCLVLLKIFRILGLPSERVVIYAWHPLCFWEIASSGHIDAAALTFLTLAIYARIRNSSVATGGWLAAATLIKLYPAALLPAFFDPTKRGQSKWTMPAVFAAVVALGIRLLLQCRDTLSSDYLPGYAQEEGHRNRKLDSFSSLANRTLAHCMFRPR
jgi:alpha-1,6-mannosyltransferase